jgi:hypothetical protein
MNTCLPTGLTDNCCKFEAKQKDLNLHHCHSSILL